jgi:hypothetical protein
VRSRSSGGMLSKRLRAVSRSNFFIAIPIFRRFLRVLNPDR